MNVMANKDSMSHTISNGVVSLTTVDKQGQEAHHTLTVDEARRQFNEVFGGRLDDGQLAGMFPDK